MLCRPIIQLAPRWGPTPARVGTDERDLIGLLGEQCEVVTGFKENQNTIETDIPGKIINIIRRRPLNLSEISDSLGIPKGRTTKYVYLLERQGIIESITYGIDLYYQLKR